MPVQNRSKPITRDRAASRIGTRRYLSYRVLPALGVLCLIAAVAAAAVLASNVFLLAFAGVLLAVLLHSITALTQRLLGLRYGWSLTIVLAVLAALLTAGGWFLASEAFHQFRELQKTLSVEQIRSSLARYPWASNLADSLSLEEVLSQRRVVSGVTGAFSTALGAIANAVIVAFVGVYLAVNPRLYRDGFLQLIPPARRDLFARLLAKLRATLSWWLVGRLVNMTIVGVATAMGLVLLGAPLPIALGIIAFVFGFVPYIGPILSVIPAVLVSLSQGTDLALYVVTLYIGVQGVESYLLTPMIQQRAVRLPPALTLLWQVLLGVLFGVLGIMLATPLLAVVMVTVKTLYLKQDA